MFNSIYVSMLFTSIVSTVLCFPRIHSMFSVIPLQNEDDYTLKRSAILKKEKAGFIGGKLVMTEKEKKVNEIIMQAKLEELLPSYKNESVFLPSMNFLDVKSEISNSEMFQIIKKLPKGSSLHTHMLAGVNIDFIIKNLTYRDNLYGGFINDVFKLHFFEGGSQDNRCDWKLLSDMRKENPNFDEWLRKRFLIENENRTSVENVWKAFKKIFNTGYEMFSYREVFEDTIYQLLLELYQDNVFYTELRGTIMPLYDLDRNDFSPREYFEILLNSVEKFKKDHPDFIGARYIHSIYRGVQESVLQEGIDEIIELKSLFPNLIAGFDLVGHEEEGNSLFHYHDILLKAQEHIPFFFHAGETNWYGHTDLNLLDAVLLKSKRLGHGYAIVKHPEILELAKTNDIPVEICPISNQVLLLHEDTRSHPAAQLLSVDYPVVICNDDPSIWEATGLSYDWYIAFMAMTPQKAGIAVLRTFAMNSIKYSAMTESERTIAYDIWTRKWEQFLDSLVEVDSNS